MVLFNGLGISLSSNSSSSSFIIIVVVVVVVVILSCVSSSLCKRTIVPNWLWATCHCSNHALGCQDRVQEEELRFQGNRLHCEACRGHRDYPWTFLCMWVWLTRGSGSAFKKKYILSLVILASQKSAGLLSICSLSVAKRDFLKKELDVEHFACRVWKRYERIENLLAKKGWWKHHPFHSFLWDHWPPRMLKRMMESSESGWRNFPQRWPWRLPLRQSKQICPKNPVKHIYIYIYGEN